MHLSSPGKGAVPHYTRCSAGLSTTGEPGGGGSGSPSRWRGDSGLGTPNSQRERFPRPDCSGSRCTFIAAAIKPGKAKCSHVEKSAGFTVPWWLSRPSGSLLRSALRVRTLVRRPRLRRKVHRVRAFGSVGASFAKCCRRRRGVSAESATRPYCVLFTGRHAASWRWANTRAVRVRRWRACDSDAVSLKVSLTVPVGSGPVRACCGGWGSAWRWLAQAGAGWAGAVGSSGLGALARRSGLAS